MGEAVSLPEQDFTAQSLDNLRQLLDSKASLIKKALGISALPTLVHTDSIVFPWLENGVDTKAAKRFITSLPPLAKWRKHKRTSVRWNVPWKTRSTLFDAFCSDLGSSGTSTAMNGKCPSQG